MQRINVIGTSGSGKSWFAKNLATRLNFNYIEMDALNWKSDWQEASPEDFLAGIQHAISGNSWVLDGNYSRTNALKWEQADTVIWIDYGFFLTFYQVIKRSFQRAWSQEELWKGTGNKESFKRSFFSSDSVIHWMLINYRRNKKRYARLMYQPPNSNIKCIRIRSRKDAELFLNTQRKKQAI